MKALNNFRILEYKDCFKVERLFEDKEYAWWDIFKLNPLINLEYRTITEQGEYLSISNLRLALDIFDTKEKAENWIDDFYKYPIIHEARNRIGNIQELNTRSTTNQEG